jgi:hypothetical protein
VRGRRLKAEDGRALGTPGMEMLWSYQLADRQLIVDGFPPAHR